MNAQSPLPRVTYSNIGADFSTLHDWLDEQIPLFLSNLSDQNRCNVINGVSDQRGKPFRVTSPINKSYCLGSFIDADQSAIDDAVEAARKAFPGWASQPWQERVKVMRRFADEIDRRKYDLGMAALFEVGKSRLEAIGEAEEAVDLVAYYCDEMEKNQGYTRQMARAIEQEETICTLKPIGTFAVISPFNFPIALACNMLGACLIAGNTAIFKPSPEASLSGTILMECATAAEIPAGVINLVCGETAGPLLSLTEGIDGFAFTGSHEVGMALANIARNGSYARPIIAKMGGKNPTYITATADLDTASEGLMRSAFGLQREKCSAGSIAYVEETVYASFLELIVEKTGNLTICSPEHRDCFVGPVIDDKALTRFDKAAAAALKDGKIALGGTRLTDGDLASGNFVAPTIVTDLPSDHWINREELFLPFLSIQRCSSLAEGITQGNKVPFGLTAGCYTGHPEELLYFTDNAEAGVLYANRRSGATTGAWPGFQTFCGWKGSGIDGKGGLGPNQIPRFMREQSHTIMHL